MFYTYYDDERFRETLPSYPPTLLFNYMLVLCTFTRMQHSADIWLICSFAATFDWLRALCAACWVYIRDHGLGTVITTYCEF